jgi:hypothetical protein
MCGFVPARPQAETKVLFEKGFQASSLTPPYDSGIQGLAKAVLGLV